MIFFIGKSIGWGASCGFPLGNPRTAYFVRSAQLAPMQGERNRLLRAQFYLKDRGCNYGTS
jgi:hypothetical protein